MILDLVIYRLGETLHAECQHIFIAPVNEMKTVMLKIEQFSDLNGEISDIEVHDKSFSFTLDVSNDFWPGKRTFQIVGKEENLDVELQGSSLYWSQIVNEKIKTEWRSTGKPTLTFPYREVF